MTKVAPTDEAISTPRANAGLIKAWDTVLFDKMTKYEGLLVEGLGAHGTKLIDAYPPAAGDSVLDCGCGWGDSTAYLASKVKEGGGMAVGVDCAPRFIEKAKEKYGDSGAEFVAMDVEYDNIGENKYDAVYARFGTQFFINPVKGFKNMCKALKPGGSLRFTVWRMRQDNPFLYTAQKIAERHISLEETTGTDEVTCGPGPFANAGADMMSTILMKAGFDEITFRRFDADTQIGRTLDEAVEFSTSMGPAGEKIRLAQAKPGIDAESKKKEILDEVRATYEPLVGENGVWMGSSTWLITAVKKA